MAMIIYITLRLMKVECMHGHRNLPLTRPSYAHLWAL